MENKPIVVLISLDTVRADALSCYGNPYGRNTTPSIDALAKQGARFKTVYSNSSFTPPSHMSLLTGLYPNRFSVGGAGQLFSDIPTLAELLSKNQFVTSAMVSEPLLEEYGFARGFDRYLTNGSPSARLRELTRTIKQAREAERGAFLFLHYFDAHSTATRTGYDAPAPFQGRYSKALGEAVRANPRDAAYDCSTISLLKQSMHGVPMPKAVNEYLRARYDECVAYLDFEVGRIVKELQRLGVYDRATIIITSDHGEFFGEHNRYLHGFPWEEGHRIPLVIKPPIAQQHKAIEVDGLVELVDLFPTILDAAEVPFPVDAVDGRSLWTCATGELAVAPKTTVFAETLFNAFVRDKQHKLTRVWMGIEEDRLGDHLYDLGADPGENMDTTEADSKKAFRLKQRLDQWLSNSYSPLYISISNDGKKHRYEATITTKGRFETETLLIDTYTTHFQSIEPTKIVIDEEMDPLVTGFHIESIPLRAQVEIRVKVDGKPIPASDIFIGSRNAQQNGVALFSLDDPALLEPINLDYMNSFMTRPTLIVLRRSPAPSKRYRYSKDMRQKMKELGYF